jgi:phospholipase/carboxylesterase
MAMLRRTLLMGGLMGGVAALATPILMRSARGAYPPAAESLDGPRIDAANGDAEWLVVLCHGSGGDGPNMIGLGPALQPYLPSAAFVAPTGPFPRDDFGYRWFPGAVAGDAIGMVMMGMREGGPVFWEFIAAELARLNLGPERLILLGFSQGSMMVLNAGLRRQPKPAAIIAFAGLRVAEEGLGQIADPPPVLIVQGALDGDPARVQETVDILAAHGVSSESHVLPNLGHAIDQRGIRLAGEFIKAVAEGSWTPPS